MLLYTRAQVEAAAKIAGWSADDAKIASAIALCEAPVSKDGIPYADAHAVGDLDRVGELTSDGRHWDASYGVFQVRTIKEESGKGTYRDPLYVKDNLDHQCRAALKVKQLQGFDAWTTYRNGAYKAYLQDIFPPARDEYIVVAGDTFLGIDAKLSLLPGTMQSLNPGVDPRKLQIGQHLKRPPIPGVFDHTVAPGETLYAIGRLYTVPWRDIADYNGIAEPYTIHTGQVLRIPKG